LAVVPSKRKFHCGHAPMKKLVVCCDGTGNEVSENISNVLKFYRALRKTEKTTPRQVVFYDPGPGTLARPDPWVKFRQDAVTVLGLATGYGLDENILNAYRFLIKNHEEGDPIYLFGFSRGAYTVRVLAALIHKVGLLFPQQLNLADAALAAYKQSIELDSVIREDDADNETDVSSLRQDDRATQFARIVTVKWPTIHFLGAWDTVASVIVPRPDRFYTFSFQELPHTRRNPSVRTFRHAIALDERRRMFRLHTWNPKQVFMSNRFSKTNNSFEQDIKEVWFSGVHADIGGGYPELESALSKYPLLWMIGEAEEKGLKFNAQSVNQLAFGIQREGSPFSYVNPNYEVENDAHNSLSLAWKPLEYLPKSDRYKEWMRLKSFAGHYIPRAEPRPVPNNAWIHESVLLRKEKLPSYQPINLPPAYDAEPMPEGPPYVSKQPAPQSTSAGLSDRGGQ
jgi:uncharacterized protein (DUF2235 family)